jgi:DNA-binding SARP family transcriptional activator
MWFGLLGELRVRGDDGVEISLAGERQRVVLAALLVRTGQVVPAGELAEIVWDGAPPDSAPVTLRSHIKRLRQGLGPARSRVVTFRNGYLIKVSGEELDLLQFDNLCAKGASAGRSGDWDEASRVLTDALELWRGRPFADIPSAQVGRAEAPRLEELRLQALEWRNEADLRLGRPERLIAELQGLAAAHPLRERFHVQLMLALSQSGRRAEALATYRQARDVLVEELGIDPGTELQEMHQRILTGDRDPATREPPANGDWATDGIPHQLPVRMRDFAGRSKELERLTEMLGRAGSGGTVMISAIGGTAGIGKTALAVHWAHHVAERFPDGQLYVNLRGYDPTGTAVEPFEAIRGFLDALHVPPSRIPVGLDAQIALYRSLVAGKRMLIVIDNARNASHARPLLPGSDGCVAVVTGRGQLAGLVAAEGAHLLDLGLLTDAEARELLIGRIGAARVADDAQAIAELARLCAGLPLALSIVAARAAARPGLPLAAFVNELRDDRALLDALDAGDATASVRAVFSWSYQNLTASAARMFRLLGVHPGPDIAAAAAARLADVSSQEARQLLDELVSVHILTERVAGRFAFHDLLRAYAIEEGKAHESGDLRAALRRLLDYYLHTAHVAAVQLNPSRDILVLPGPRPGPEIMHEAFADHRGALAWFEAEHTALLAAISRAAEVGLDSHVGHISWSLADYLDRRGHWRDWAQTQRTAEKAASRARDLAGQARACRGAGRACTELRDYPQARRYLIRAVDLYRQLGDTIGQGRAHLALARLWEYQERYREGLENCQRARRLFESAGHQAGQASARNAIGWCHAHLGNYAQALGECEQALHLYRLLGDIRGEAVTYDSLGYAHYHVGDYSQARRCYRGAMALFRDLGDKYNQASTLTRLGDADVAADDREAARSAWHEALAILSHLDHPDAEEVRSRLRAHVQRAPGPSPAGFQYD